MGRSFGRVSVDELFAPVTYNHERSEQHFSVYRRDGHLYQRRHQTGPDGREINAVEMEMRFVLGSGNHARTYLSLLPGGALVGLPLGWYAEGGTWAMNPGYDRADHMDFRRRID